MVDTQHMWRVVLIANGVFAALYGIAVFAATRAGFEGTQGISLLLTVLIIALIASSIATYKKQGSMTAQNRFFRTAVLSPAVISGILLLYSSWVIFLS